MALVCTLVIVGLGIGAAGTAAADTTDGNATLVLDQPDEAIPTDGSGEIDLRVEGADNGVGAYELTLLVVDPDTLTLETAEVSGEGDDGPLVDVERTDGDDELLLTLSVTLLDATHDPADEITLASLTVAGHETGEAVVSIADVEEFADQDSERYDTSTTDTTVTVQEADDTTQAPNDLDALLDAMDGTGTEDDPYVITNASELQAINADSDAHYVLGDDIDASGTSEWNNGSGFEPIGTATTEFKGTFDGNNHTITGLEIDRNPGRDDGVALFGNTEGSTITAVGLEDVEIRSEDRHTGSLVGDNNGEVAASHATGEVTGSSYVGGLVGFNNDGTVTESHATVTVISDSDAGGLVGENRNVIERSYATGTVTGDTAVGGVVGDNQGTVKESYATGTVTGQLFVGGLIGLNRDTTTESYATATVVGDDDRVGGLVGANWEGTIEESYATGNVTGELVTISENRVGGLVGWNEQGTVERSFWDTNQTTQSESDGGLGLDTTRMVGENALGADNMSTLNQETWETVSDGSPPSADGDGYPILQTLEPEPQIKIPTVEKTPELSGLDVDGQGETATVDEGEFINDIEVDVANVGEQESSFTLELVIEDSDGVEIEQTLTTLEIEPGESRNIEFVPDVTDLDAGQYTVTIADSDGVSAVTGTLTIDAESEPASFEVDIDEEATETEITQGDNLSVVATITNTGDVTGVRNISAEVNSPDSTAGMGTPLGSLELQSGESDTIEWTLENVSFEPGEYFIDIDSEDTSDSVDVTILGADEPTEPVSTLIVDKDGDVGNYTSISAAVDDAADGDTIEVRSGTYDESVWISKNVTLVAPNGATIANSSDNGPNGITFDSQVAPDITGFHLTGWELALSASGTELPATIVDVTITDSDRGVGLFHTEAALTVENVSVSDTAVGINIIRASGEWKVHNSTIDGATNSAINAPESDGDFSVRNTTITHSDKGIDIGEASGDWDIQQTTIENTAGKSIEAIDTTGNGAIRDTTITSSGSHAIELDNSQGDLWIENTTIHDADKGIDADNVSGSTVVRDVTVTNVSDGVIVQKSSGDWQIESTIVKNSSGDGIDAYRMEADGLVQNTTVDGAEGKGIDLYDSTGTVSIENTTVENAGPGIGAADSDLNISISDSRIAHTDVGLIGINAATSWQIDDVTVTDNIYDGIIANDSSGDWVIDESTIRNNGFSGIFAGQSSGNWSISETVFSENGNEATGSDIQADAVTATEATGQWTITESNFLDSDGSALDATGAQPEVNASHSYWGAVDGPSGDFDGSGGEVVGNVIVDPYSNDTIVLEPAQEVNGEILQPDGQTPAANERIDVRSQGDESGDRVWTDDNGIFEAELAEGGQYTVGFTQVAGEGQDEPTFPQDGVPDVYALANVTSASDAELGTRILPEGHSLTVEVVGPEGQPVTDVELFIGSVANDASFYTEGAVDDDGTFTAEVNGTVDVFVDPESDDLEPNSTGEFDVSEDDTVVTIALDPVDPTVSVTGSVEYANGDAATGYEMGLVDEDSNITDDAGTFELRPEPNDLYSFSFRQTDFDNATADFPKDGRPDIHAFGGLEVGESAMDVDTQTLPEAHLVNVTVETVDGEPVSAADVVGGATEEPFGVGASATTRDDGEVVLDGSSSPGIEINGTLRVLVEESDDLARNLTDFTIDDDREITVVVNDRVNVSGQLVNESGAELTGYDIQVDRDTIPYGGGIADETGGFSVSVGANQTYSLVAVQNDTGTFAPRDGATDLYQIDATEVGATDRNLGDQEVPDAKGVLNVTVTNESAVPVENAIVTITPTQAETTTTTSQGIPSITNADGHFTVDGTPGIEAAGNYTIQIERPPGDDRFVDNLEMRTVNVTSDTNIEVTLTETDDDETDDGDGADDGDETDDGDDDETDSGDGAEGGEGAVFNVSNLEPAGITMGTDDTVPFVSATVTNTGDVEATTIVELRVNGNDTVLTENVTIGAGNETTIEFSEIELDLEPGEYEYGVFTEDNEQTGDLTIISAEDETDDSTDDTTPGFGPLVALIAMLIATALFRRRGDY